MKTYIKNKNFIPEKIRCNMELNQNKRQNIIIVLFLILNLTMLHTTVEDIFKVKEKPLPNKAMIKKTPEYSEDINIWINNIFNNNIEEAHITNNNGDIIINNFDGVDKLNLNSSIRINDINLNNNEKYKLGVSLNE